MSADELYELMDNPSSLSADTLPELKRMVDEYPFSHVLCMLYLKNLAILEDPSFNQELKRMAITVPDRKKLFMLIEGERYGIKPVMLKEGASGDKEDAFQLIDSFLLSQLSDVQSTEAALLLEPSVSSDYMYWSLTKGMLQDEGAGEVPLKHQELIDSFIEQDENRQPGSLLEMELKESENEKAEVPSSVKELDDAYLKKLDESYFTETLARIYVKQRRYEKALQIIKNLSLKYPEKNVYFADQIRFLEKLIINTKK